MPARAQAHATKSAHHCIARFPLPQSLPTCQYALYGLQYVPYGLALTPIWLFAIETICEPCVDANAGVPSDGTATSPPAMTDVSATLAKKRRALTRRTCDSAIDAPGRKTCPDPPPIAPHPACAMSRQPYPGS